jgi:superoxide dismutase, Fe-Mn family
MSLRRLWATNARNAPFVVCLLIMLLTAARNRLRTMVTTAAPAAFTLPPLPYAEAALEPHISRETIQYHYGKHHAAYVTNLNNFVAKTPELQGKTLEQIVATATGPIFNNAAQVWNHTFYWNSMSPNGGGQPKGKVKELIERDFGSFDAFKQAFTATATGHFASGWAWLVKGADGKLKIVDTHDAGHPVREGKGAPILTCDVWEHAYYVDYRNARAKYLESYWNVVNWDFANKNLEA